MKIKEMMGRKGENDDSPKGGIFFYFQYTHTVGSVLEKRRLLTPKDFPLFSKGVSLWLEIQKKKAFSPRRLDQRAMDGVQQQEPQQLSSSYS